MRQALVLVAYRSSVRQLSRWGLTLLLLLGYGTALGLRHFGVSMAFERVELVSLHRAFGILLVGLLLVLTYDRVQSGRPLKPDFKNATPSEWVDIGFFTGLGLIAVVGLLLHLKTRLGWHAWPDLAEIKLAHELMVWFFPTLILVRYYLWLTRWFKRVIAYLREN